MFAGNEQAKSVARFGEMVWIGLSCWGNLGQLQTGWIKSRCETEDFRLQWPIIRGDMRIYMMRVLTRGFSLS